MTLLLFSLFYLIVLEMIFYYKKRQYNKITSPKVQNLNLNKRTPTIALLKRKNEQ